MGEGEVEVAEEEAAAAVEEEGGREELVAREVLYMTLDPTAYPFCLP